MMSGEVELRWPRRRPGKRSSVSAPPIQWMRRMISAASASLWRCSLSFQSLKRGSEAIVGIDLHVRAARKLGLIAHTLELLTAEGIGPPYAIDPPWQLPNRQAHLHRSLSGTLIPEWSCHRLHRNGHSARASEGWP